MTAAEPFPMADTRPLVVLVCTVPLLSEAGYARVFTMGSDTREIVAYLSEWWAARAAAPR